MGSGGGSKPPPPSLTLAQHRTTSHGTARQIGMLSSSQTSRGSCTDPRYKARATSAKNHAQAHAARSRYPLAHPRPHPAFRKPSPPASARPDHHRSRSERLRAAQRRCRSTWSRRRLPPRKLRRRGEAYRLVVPISPSKFGTAARFSPRRRLSSKLRPRGVVLDELGSGGPSNEAGLHHREHSS